ncbi:MAG: hypothetical protein A2X40_08155 [Elusimicrobia bacterium GWC2_65_9]|nr:MAG: hypothetical protein A2X40_08155 [Elusimicrobia bacterium GWC2_65_9]OHC66078.1 MAG: hypothetical protein A2040_03820 [Rhodocyclales bacterium GWA2_65_19]
MRALLSDGMIQTSGWLFAAFMVSNVFSYGFQVAMGRLLTPAEYGFLNSLLAVFVVLSVPLATVPMVLARKTAEYGARNDFTRIRSLIRLAHRRLLFAGLFGLAVFALGARFLADYLHAPSVVPILILGLCACSSFAVPVNAAVLQGLQDYKWMGINAGLGGPARFFFCVALVAAGFGVNGVLAGMVLCNLTLWLVTCWPIRRHLLRGADGPDHVHQLSLAHMFPVFLANLAFTVLTQADMILVARYFPAHEAGMYAATAILGRSVMYVPGAFVQAMFPMVSDHHSRNRDSRHLLFKALGATLCLSGFGAALFFLFPKLIISVFFGARYAEAAPVLRCFGPAILPMAVLMVLMNYSIAKGERRFAYVMALGALLEVAFICLRHDSLLKVVFVLMAVGVFLIAVGLGGRWGVGRQAEKLPSA